MCALLYRWLLQPPGWLIWLRSISNKSMTPPLLQNSLTDKAKLSVCVCVCERGGEAGLRWGGGTCDRPVKIILLWQAARLIPFAPKVNSLRSHFTLEGRLGSVGGGGATSGGQTGEEEEKWWLWTRRRRDRRGQKRSQAGKWEKLGEKNKSRGDCSCGEAVKRDWLWFYHHGWVCDSDYAAINLF